MDSSEEGTTPDEKADDQDVSMETTGEKTEELAEDQDNDTPMKDNHVVVEPTTEDEHLNFDEAPVVELCVGEVNDVTTAATGSDDIPEDDDMEPPVLTPELVADLHKENVNQMSEQIEISEAVVVTSDIIGASETVDGCDTSSEDSVEIRIEETEVVVDTEVKDAPSQNVVREVVITTVTQEDETSRDSVGDTETGKKVSQGVKKGSTPVQKNTRQRILHLRSKGPELRQKSTAQKTLTAVKQEIENSEALRQLKPKVSSPQVIFTIKQEKEENEEDEEDDDDEDEEEEDEEDSSSLLVDVKSEEQGGFRPVRPVERQKMRPWMIELLDKGNIPGLSWQNRRDRIFRISWKHAAHNCFNRDRDSDLFERWAVHTGRHYEGNHKRWKANFRCALNSLPDVIELRDLGVRKGDNAFKVYKFLDTNDPVYKDRIDNKGKRTSSSYSRASVGKYESKNVKATDIREIQLDEGGTLHTLLHAIELQQQGAVTEKTTEAKKSTGKRSSDKSSDVSTEAKKPKTEEGAETKTGKVSLVQVNKTEHQAEKKLDDPVQSVAVDTSKSGDKAAQAVPQQQNLGELGMVIPPGTGFITFGKGAEQKIVLPIGKTGLDPTAATLSFPAVNMINTGQDKGQGQEQKITIPLAQLAAVLAQSHQQQQQAVKTGVTANVELKPLEAVPALYSPPHPSTLAIAKPASLGILTPAGLTNLSVVSSLQQGQGQFVTFATGATQGQMNTTLVSTQTTRTHPVAKVTEQKIPSTVLEAMDISGNKIKCKPDTVASLQKTVTSQPGLNAKPLLSPTKHTVNKELTSLAAALKVRPPGQPTQIRPVFPPPINVNPVAKSMPGTATPPVRSIESQGVRNKLVTRLLISGASTTTPSTHASLPSSPSIPQPSLAQMGTLRPSLDLVNKQNQQATTSPTTPQLQNLKASAMSSILISSSGEPMQVLGNQYPRATDSTVVSSVPQSEQVAATTVIQTAPQTPALPVVATTQIVTAIGAPQVAAHQVAAPPVAAVGKEKPPVTTASSSKNCPEFLEQVTIDLRDMQDVNKETADSSSPAAQQFAYSCLWCKIDFSKKIDLLQHFMNLHQDMLMVPGETEAAHGHLPAESQTALNQDQGQSLGEDPLDLRTPGNKDGDAVRVEVVPYSEIIDMSCTRKRRKPKTVKEALIRKKKGNVESGNKDILLPKGVKATSVSGLSISIEKRKRAKSKRNKSVDKLTLSVEGGSGLGEGSASGQMTPGSLSESESQRPKYSLTSLIEALRESIERDKSKGAGMIADGLQSNVAEGQAKTGEDVCYDDLSSSSQSDEDEDEEDEDEDDILEVEGMNSRIGDTEENNVQVSVKTFQVDGKTMYKCSVCSKVFSKTCTFARHAMVHSKMYPYQCGLCDEKCSDMRVLLRHLDWHGENVDCPCKKCERLHKGNPDKKDGIRGADGVNTSKFFCEICGREFLSDVACKAHVNMHKRGDNLVCEICHLSFYCNRVLSKHRKSAHGVQFCPYCLETCHLDMASHMSEHTGVYMYRCGLCGDGYNSRPLLHEHLKIHTHLGKEFSQDKRDSLEALSKKGHNTGKHAERLKSGALKSLNRKGKKKFIKGAKNKTVLSQKKTGKPKLIHTGEPGETTADGKAGKKNPARTMKRKCRWHDNDSVCERCDVSFVKKIAFGRKPKSKPGKDSPRPSESGSLDSFTLDGDNVKAKINPSESPVKVVVSDHDYGTDVAEIANAST